MAIIANIFIDQGTDFSITVDVTDTSGGALNMSGYSAAAQIRKTYGSSSVSSTFSTSIAENTGQVTLSLTDTQTTALESGRYVYDLELTDAANVVSRIVEGTVTVTPQVTSS